MINRGSRVHLIGVGGIGMSGLASVLVSQGVQVSGSDLQVNHETKRLQARGARIHQGHDVTHIASDLDSVIVSSAIQPDHEEVLAAEQLKIPVVPRLLAVAQVLRSHRSVGVAGTHGKTTTTAMIASILKHQGQKPSYLVGADCPGLGGNACLDEGQWFVAEIDESDGYLVEVPSDVSVLTNIGRDHLHTYDTVEDIERTFTDYLKRSTRQVLCVDDERVRHVAQAFPAAITVATDGPANLVANGIVYDQWRTSFDLVENGRFVGHVVLPAPGRHNVRNALCALAAARLTGLSLPQAIEGLAAFQLPHRRFELLEENGVTVVDDYAHLPEEIDASLQAIRSGWPGRRVIAVFQPHRYSRTKALGSEFGAAFAKADIVLVNPIYSACESWIPGTTSLQIVDAIRRDTSSSVQMVDTKNQTVRVLEELIREDDFIISFGAGDVWKVTERLARILEAGHFLRHARRR